MFLQKNQENPKKYEKKKCPELLPEANKFRIFLKENN